MASAEVVMMMELPQARTRHPRTCSERNNERTKTTLAILNGKTGMEERFIDLIKVSPSSCCERVHSYWYILVNSSKHYKVFFDFVD